MKNKTLIYFVILLGIISLFLTTCKKENTKVVPTVTLSANTNIGVTEATFTVELNSTGGESLTEQGVCWSTSNASPTIWDQKATGEVNSNSYTITVTNLTPETTYHLRAYAINSIGTGYSVEIIFTTLSLTNLPQVRINDASVLPTGTLANITVTGDGGFPVTARGLCWSWSSTPTVNDNKSNDGSGIGSFTSNVSGLPVHSFYNFRAYATNKAGTGYSESGIGVLTTPLQSYNGIVFNPGLTYGTVTDIDGNVYKTIQIGTQTWMAENLKTTKYRNGDPIPNVADYAAMSILTTGAYCWLHNNKATYEVFGAFYNWYAASDNRNIAPTGWHVATNAEWNTLVSFLGGRDVSGIKLKETGTYHWPIPNDKATNESGFTALPGALLPGVLSNNHEIWGAWWCSTFNPIGYADSWSLNWESGLSVGGNDFSRGMTVRCVKD